MTIQSADKANSAGVLVSPQIQTKSRALFSISEDARHITCNLCGHVSSDPAHVQQRFCPNCRTYHEDHVLMQRLDEGLHAVFPVSPQTNHIPIMVANRDWNRSSKAA